MALSCLSYAQAQNEYPPNTTANADAYLLRRCQI
jgi:hypothetical protein